MKFDELMQEIGEFGPLQKRVYFLAILPVVMSGFEALSVVFTFNIPAHRCAIPGFPNDQYAIINDTHARLINASIPEDEDRKGRWSQCLLYNNVTHDVIFSNLSDGHVGMEAQTKETSPCQKWVYDHSVFDSTIATDFNTVCQNSVIRATSNMLSEMGSAFGYMLAGLLADRFGRKVPFYLGAVTLSAGGFGIAFTTELVSFNFCRILIGIARQCLFSIGLLIGMEIVGPSKRVFAGSCIEVAWCLGIFVLVIFAYLIRNWRYLEIAISVPSVVLLAYWWLIPESPRWLASKGREQEALKILEKIAASNKTTLPKVDDFKSLLEGETTLTFCQVIRSRELVVRTLIFFVNTTVLMAVYYGFIYNISNMGGDIYINYLINAIMESLGLCLPYFIVDRLGRKKVYCGSMIIGGVFGVLCIIPALSVAPEWVIMSLANCGRFLICVAFSTIFIYGTELFPTIVRGSTMGVAVTASRIGGIVSPYLADLGVLVGGRLEQVLPLVITGVPAVLAGVLALSLPETKGVSMPETMGDLLQLQSKWRCPCSSVDEDDSSSSQDVTSEEEMKNLPTSV